MNWNYKNKFLKIYDIIGKFSKFTINDKIFVIYDKNLRYYKEISKVFDKIWNLRFK